MQNKVLIKTDDYEVSEKDVDQFLMTMGQQGLQFQNEEGKKQIANELMNQHLIYKDALANGLEESEEFKRELEIAKEQILRQMAMQNILAGVEVSDEEVKDFYEKHKDQFKDMYKYRASHILTEDEETAQKALDEINQGRDFAELAKEISTCPSSEKGGDLGEFTSGQMVPEFDQALEEMEVGEVRGIVKTQFGYHIIKLDQKDLLRGGDFDAYKADIRNLLLGQKQQELYLKKTSELQDKYKVEKNF